MYCIYLHNIMSNDFERDQLLQIIVIIFLTNPKGFYTYLLYPMNARDARSANSCRSVSLIKLFIKSSFRLALKYACLQIIIKNRCDRNRYYIQMGTSYIYIQQYNTLHVWLGQVIMTTIPRCYVSLYVIEIRASIGHFYQNKINIPTPKGK